MKSIEVSAKTVSEARAKGCQELGCTPEDVNMEVLEIGSPGLFGLFGKPARVRLTMKVKDEDLDIDVQKLMQEQPGKKSRSEAPRREKKPQPEKAAPREAPAAPVEEAEEAGDEAPVAEKKPSRRRNRRGRGGEKREAAPEREVETIPTPLPAPEPFVETPEEALSETARKARDFLSELTAKMNVPAQIAVCDSPEQVRMVLSGENMSILIGRRGETLDALQYLTSLHVNMHREEYVRISLDTEDYRARREEALMKLAVRMANRCKKSGRRVALEPMNPYERRILHSALQADPEVTTHSEGEEPFRRVIITLK